VCVCNFIVDESFRQFGTHCQKVNKDMFYKCNERKDVANI